MDTKNEKVPIQDFAEDWFPNTKSPALPVAEVEADRTYSVPTDGHGTRCAAEIRLRPLLANHPNVELIPRMKEIGKTLGKYYRIRYGVEKINVLSVDQAVNGPTPDMSMLMNTSTGASFQNLFSGAQKKSSIFVKREDGTYTFDDKVCAQWTKAEIDAQWENLAKGKVETLPSSLSYKSELLPNAKVWRKRIVNCVDVVSVINQKRILAPIQQILTSDFHKSEFQLKMSPSIDWHHMISDFLELGNMFIELDASSFDQTVPLQAYEGVIALLQAMYDVEPNTPLGRRIATMCYHMCFTPLLVGNTVISKQGGLPSGIWGTSLMDTLLTLVMAMDVFSEHMFPGERPVLPEEFFNIMRPKGCGDDFLASVNIQFVNQIHLPTVQSMYRKRHGIEYTSGTKGNEELHFKSIGEVTFLSRYTVRMPKFPQFWCSKLKDDAISGVLHWTKHSTPAGVYEQLVAVRRELIARGEKFYEVFERALRQYCINHNLDCYQAVTFDAMLRETVEQIVAGGGSTLLQETYDASHTEEKLLLPNVDVLLKQSTSFIPTGSVTRKLLRKEIRKHFEDSKSHKEFISGAITPVLLHHRDTTPQPDFARVNTPDGTVFVPAPGTIDWWCLWTETKDTANYDKDFAVPPPPIRRYRSAELWYRVIESWAVAKKLTENQEAWKDFQNRARLLLDRDRPEMDPQAAIPTNAPSASSGAAATPTSTTTLGNSPAGLTTVLEPSVVPTGVTAAPAVTTGLGEAPPPLVAAVGGIRGELVSQGGYWKGVIPLAYTPQILGTLPLSTGTSAGTVIGSWDFDPWSDRILSPPAKAFADLHSSFFGTIDLKFTIVSTPMVFGQIMLATVPGPFVDSVQPTIFELQRFPNVQLNLAQSTSFTINFGPTTKSGYWIDRSDIAAGNKYGRIYMLTVTPIQSSFGADTQINVLMHSCFGADADYSWGGPITNPTPALNDLDIQTENAQIVVDGKHATMPTKLGALAPSSVSMPKYIPTEKMLIVPAQPLDEAIPTSGSQNITFHGKAWFTAFKGSPPDVTGKLSVSNTLNVTAQNRIVFPAPTQGGTPSIVYTSELTGLKSPPAGQSQYWSANDGCLQLFQDSLSPRVPVEVDYLNFGTYQVKDGIAEPVDMALYKIDIPDGNLKGRYLSTHSTGVVWVGGHGAATEGTGTAYQNSALTEGVICTTGWNQHPETIDGNYRNVAIVTNDDILPSVLQGVAGRTVVPTYRELTAWHNAMEVLKTSTARSVITKLRSASTVLWIVRNRYGMFVKAPDAGDYLYTDNLLTGPQEHSLDPNEWPALIGESNVQWRDRFLRAAPAPPPAPSGRSALPRYVAPTSAMVAKAMKAKMAALGLDDEPQGLPSNLLGSCWPLQTKKERLQLAGDYHATKLRGKKDSKSLLTNVVYSKTQRNVYILRNEMGNWYDAGPHSNKICPIRLEDCVQIHTYHSVSFVQVMNKVRFVWRRILPKVSGDIPEMLPAFVTTRHEGYCDETCCPQYHAWLKEQQIAQDEIAARKLEEELNNTAISLPFREEPVQATGTTRKSRIFVDHVSQEAKELAAGNKLETILHPKTQEELIRTCVALATDTLDYSEKAEVARWCRRSWKPSDGGEKRDFATILRKKNDDFRSRESESKPAYIIQDDQIWWSDYFNPYTGNQMEVAAVYGEIGQQYDAGLKPITVSYARHCARRGIQAQADLDEIRMEKELKRQQELTKEKKERDKKFADVFGQIFSPGDGWVEVYQPENDPDPFVRDFWNSFGPMKKDRMSKDKEEKQAAAAGMMFGGKALSGLGEGLGMVGEFYGQRANMRLATDLSKQLITANQESKLALLEKNWLKRQDYFNQTRGKFSMEQTASVRGSPRATDIQSNERQMPQVDFMGSDDQVSIGSASDLLSGRVPGVQINADAGTVSLSDGYQPTMTPGRQLHSVAKSISTGTTDPSIRSGSVSSYKSANSGVTGSYSFGSYSQLPNQVHSTPDPGMPVRFTENMSRVGSELNFSASPVVHTGTGA